MCILGVEAGRVAVQTILRLASFGRIWTMFSVSGVCIYCEILVSLDRVAAYMGCGCLTLLVRHARLLRARIDAGMRHGSEKIAAAGCVVTGPCVADAMTAMTEECRPHTPPCPFLPQCPTIPSPSPTLRRCTRPPGFR